MINMMQMPDYMKPEIWTQFWQNQDNFNSNNNMFQVVQSYAQLQNQYMQRMLGEWQQLTLAMAHPDTMPQECNKFMKRAAENTMEHAQSIMKMMQDANADAVKACAPKAANKKA